MLDTVTAVIIGLLGLHIIVKFIFFALPYAQRRAALDRSYGAKSTATATSDKVAMAVTIALAALLLWRGAEAVSFLGGLWIGATLIQTYFHRFHEPLAPEFAPPPAVSPIKTMSYAIQAAPWRPWLEMTVLAALAIFCLVRIVLSLW